MIKLLCFIIVSHISTETNTRRSVRWHILNVYKMFCMIANEKLSTRSQQTYILATLVLGQFIFLIKHLYGISFNYFFGTDIIKLYASSGLIILKCFKLIFCLPPIKKMMKRGSVVFFNCILCCSID